MTNETEGPHIDAIRPASRRSFPTLRAVAALMLREMATRYGRTPGGYLWAVLEPVAGICLLAIGFSLVFSVPPLGRDFILFYATGLMPFAMFQVVAHNTAWALSFSRPLLFYPSVRWIDALLARFVLHTVTQAFVSALIFTGVWFLAKEQGPPYLPALILGMGLAALLGLGFGTLNGYLFLRFPAWNTIWGILNRPLFFASGIFYLHETLPENLKDVLYFNPLGHLPAIIRTGFYPGYEGKFVSVLFVVLCALIPLWLGLLLLRRYHKELLNRL